MLNLQLENNNNTPGIKARGINDNCMKKIILLLSALFIISFSHSQKWETIFGNVGKDESAIDVIECYDKGYLLSGSYELHNGNWIIKTDINGNILWEKYLKWDNSIVLKGNLEQTVNGETIIARCTWIDDETNWPTIVKLDSCGNEIWCRTFIDYDYENGCINDFLLFENGDILALTYLDSFQEIDCIFLYYIDKNGDLLWTHSYSSKINYPLVGHRMGSLLYPTNSMYFIVGYCYYQNPSNPNIYTLRPFFIGIDSDFNEKWIIPFGMNDTISGLAYSAISISDSVVMGLGTRRFEQGGELVNNSLLMFFNSEGVELGYNQISNSQIGADINSNFIHNVERINDTLFIASSNFGDDYTGNPYGEFIIDTAANIYSKQSRPNTIGGSFIEKTFDNKFVITTSLIEGKTDYDILFYKINDSLDQDSIYQGNYTYDSLCPFQIQSGIIDISDCLIITDVKETPTPSEYFASLNTIPIKAYPNPATKGLITFEFQNTEYHKNMELRCFDVFGEMVLEKKVYEHQGESKVNVQSWNPGIYVALVYSNSQIAGQAKFVVQ